MKWTLFNWALRAGTIENMIPVTRVRTGQGRIKFLCPGIVPYWRARTILSKEPDTIRWIDGFQQGSTLWDIGANVGVFALYAGMKGMRVVAFEPAPANYFLLVKNIEINRLSDLVSAIPIALGDRRSIENFNMRTTSFGSSLHTLGAPVDQRGEKFAPTHVIAMLSTTVDEFVRDYDPPFPNHIKLDVDGNEEQILNGAAATLKDPRLRSLLVESDVGLDRRLAEITAMLESAGLTRQTLDARDASVKEMKAVNYVFSRAA